MCCITGESQKSVPLQIDSLEIVEDLIEDEINEVELPVNQIKNLLDLLENMKTKFHDDNTSKQEKLQILTLLPQSWSYEEIKKHFDASNYMIKLSKKLLTETGPMSMSVSTKHGLLKFIFTFVQEYIYFPHKKKLYCFTGMSTVQNYITNANNFFNSSFFLNYY